MKKKILIINTVRFRLNGISAVIKNYHRAMDKDGLDIEFVAIEEPSPEYIELFNEYQSEVHVIEKKNPISYMFSLWKLCRQKKYDIVHIHGNSASMAIDLFACWLGGVGTRIVHSHNTSTTHPVAHRIMYPLFDALCTKRVACGEEAGKWLFHNKPFDVLRNGIDLEQYAFNEATRKEVRSELGLKEEVLLGHVGGFVKQKNHTFLVDVLSELVKVNSNYRVLLIGGGDLMDEIQDKVRILGLEPYVIFLGKSNQVARYLQAVDIFVLPSLHEGLPLSMIEAQAAGLPCVVSDKITVQADLTHTCRYLTIDNVQLWVDALSNIKLGQLSREATCTENCKLIRASGYDIKKTANELKVLYQEGV